MGINRENVTFNNLLSKRVLHLDYNSPIRKKNQVTLHSGDIMATDVRDATKKKKSTTPQSSERYR